MSEGMLSRNRLIAFMANGSKHEVVLKPRHVKAIQLRFREEEPVDMERTIYTCWLVLRDTGEYPGTLEEFERDLDDIGVPEELPDPKA